MLDSQQKAFCVIQFAKLKSVTLVRRTFRTKYNIDPPDPKSIRRWFKKFQETGSVKKGKTSGRPKTSEEQVERIRVAFTEDSRKSTRRASRELAIPHTTVWRMLRRRLHMKPYRLSLVQALTNDDKRKRMEFCSLMMENMDEDDTFTSRLVFSDEATFHLSGKVNRHNVRIWGANNPHEMVEHHRDSPKVNVFCAVSQNQVYGPFFFEGSTVTGQSYLDMLRNWLFPSLQADSNDFIFQQDGAPPHWHQMVRAFLNEEISHRWIGRKGGHDLAFCSWPARSPDLTVCDFFLWGYVKDQVYVPPLPNTIDDLKRRITMAIGSVHQQTLQLVWQEFSRRIDVTLASGGGHIEHL